MNRHVFFFLLVFLPVMVSAQNSKLNASNLIEEIISDLGIEEAQKKFEEILADSSQFILLENEFNALGYSLLRQRKYDEAIAVLKMNVQAFPNSWNVYDSLGEIYAWTGNTDGAIANFEKSLELNPDNENAVRQLDRIYGNIADHENETKINFQYSHGESTGIDKAYFGEEPPGLTPKLFAPGLIDSG